MPADLSLFACKPFYWFVLRFIIFLFFFYFFLMIIAMMKIMKLIMQMFFANT